MLLCICACSILCCTYIHIHIQVPYNFFTKFNLNEFMACYLTARNNPIAISCMKIFSFKFFPRAMTNFCKYNRLCGLGVVSCTSIQYIYICTSPTYTCICTYVCKNIARKNIRRCTMWRSSTFLYFYKCVNLMYSYIIYIHM